VIFVTIKGEYGNDTVDRGFWIASLQGLVNPLRGFRRGVAEARVASP
jgi:hypothetical protein